MRLFFEPLLQCFLSVEKERKYRFRENDDFFIALFYGFFDLLLDQVDLHREHSGVPLCFDGDMGRYQLDRRGVDRVLGVGRLRLIGGDHDKKIEEIPLCDGQRNSKENESELPLLDPEVTLYQHQFRLEPVESEGVKVAGSQQKECFGPDRGEIELFFNPLGEQRRSPE